MSYLDNLYGVNTPHIDQLEAALQEAYEAGINDGYQTALNEFGNTPAGRAALGAVAHRNLKQAQHVGSQAAARSYNISHGISNPRYHNQVKNLITGASRTANALEKRGFTGHSSAWGAKFDKGFKQGPYAK